MAELSIEFKHFWRLLVPVSTLVGTNCVPASTQKVYYQNTAWGASITPQIVFPDNGNVAMLPCLNGWYYRQVSAISASTGIYFQQGANNLLNDTNSCNGDLYASTFSGGFISVQTTKSSGCNGGVNVNYGNFSTHVFFFFFPLISTNKKLALIKLVPSTSDVGEVCLFSCAADSSYCQNGGTCSDAIKGKTCTCPANYAGTNCQNSNLCQSSPCQNSGVCTNTVNNFTCNCAGTGYQGRTCQTGWSLSRSERRRKKRRKNQKNPTK